MQTVASEMLTDAPELFCSSKDAHKRSFFFFFLKLDLSLIVPRNDIFTHTHPLTALILHTNEEIKLQVKTNPKILLRILKNFPLPAESPAPKAEHQQAEHRWAPAALGITHISCHSGCHPRLHHGNCKPFRLTGKRKPTKPTSYMELGTHPLPKHNNSMPVMKYLVKKPEDLILPRPV